MNIRPNRIKQKLAAGENVYVVSGPNDADWIDEVGPSELDGIWLEGEHGPVDFGNLGNLTRACDLWDMTSIVRVNRNDQTLIYRTLDRGAQGIVVPHVNTREEAENVVAGGKFAPIGQRGMFVSRQGFGVDDYFTTANEQSLLIVLIEDIVAVRNLDEILEVDHIDVFFVAPSDLAASMGYIHDQQNPEVQHIVDDTLQRIQKRGRVAGTLARGDSVERFSAAGVQFLFTATGPWMISAAKNYKNSGEAGRKQRG